MGTCLSVVAVATGAAPLHLLDEDQVDGTLDDYQLRYVEDDGGKLLGEGQFARVKLVYRRATLLAAASTAAAAAAAAAGKDGKYEGPPAGKAAAVPFACKILRKGIHVRDNVLYSPTHPEVLRGEVEILRELAGLHYCLGLEGAYESPRSIYVVTEYCAGGEMMEYVAALDEDLCTEDAARIARQLLSAVDHCARHGIVHRDIKPENVMFQSPRPKSPLRLIDFGSGCWDRRPPRPTDAATTTTSTDPSSSSSAHTNNGNNKGDSSKGSNTGVVCNANDDLHVHTTFAGTAFYNSPEMFQHSYTQKTDVWSVGVTLYVLVAGFPSDNLQRAFNTLQASSRKKGGRGDLRKLPDLPPGYMPDSYYDMLDGLLTYRHRKRPFAGEVLEQSEFVRVHEGIEEAEATGDDTNNNIRKDSVALAGTIGRHGVTLGYRKFECGLTTILATMLSKDELDVFLDVVDEQIHQLATTVLVVDDDGSAAAGLLNSEDSSRVDVVDEEDANECARTERSTLLVISVNDLKGVLMDANKGSVIEAMENLDGGGVYGNYAYHVSLLQDMCRESQSGTRKHRNNQAPMNDKRYGRCASFSGAKYDDSKGTLQSFATAPRSSLPRSGSSSSIGSNKGRYVRRRPRMERSISS